MTLQLTLSPSSNTTRCVRGCTRPVNGPVCTFYLTGKCNLRCSYCYEQGNQPVPDLTTRQIDLYLGRFEADPKIRIETMVLFGGEPCLRWDLVTHLAEATSKKRSAFQGTTKVLFTNGLLLTPQRLLQMQSWAMQLLLSFDGYDNRSDLRYGQQCADDVRRVEKTLSTAIAIGIPTTIVFTVGQHNIEFLQDDMARLKETFGVNSFSVSTIQRLDLTASHIVGTRASVFKWASRECVDIDWRHPKQLGTRYPSYFVSSSHNRYIAAGEQGTWDRTGW